MENLLPLVPSEVLEQELQKARFVKTTDRGKNQIYVFSGLDCPYLMLQVGILREMAFRAGGGGTGLAVDIDEYDEFTPFDCIEYLEPLESFPHYPGPYPGVGFKQLIVWDPENKMIMGGYRYALMKDLLALDYTELHSPTMDLFVASSEFLLFYAPFTIELGRSFVNPLYQERSNTMISRKAIFALDNLFEGLGTLVTDYKSDHIQYFFGKVTMYKTYNRQARNMILYYMQKHFPNKKKLILPKTDLIPPGLDEEIHFLKHLFVGNTEKEDKNILLKSLQEIKQTMPPLFKKYTEMSPTMQVFGTTINHHCGEVEETAIMIDFDSIVPEYKNKYILGYFFKKFGKYF